MNLNEEFVNSRIKRLNQLKYAGLITLSEKAELSMLNKTLKHNAKIRHTNKVH